VRLVRLGDETSKVGADVRAALASWGRGDAVVGGIALTGCTPPDCQEPVDAILILPRGVIVIVGVDLPDPAMRLDAPVGGQWKIDGWPLVRQDGAVNPATEALHAAKEVTSRLQAQRVEPMPVGTVIAVGPYVSRVSQPTSDLARGIRILHPEPRTLLTATRELAVYERRCAVHPANAILAALAPDHPPFSADELVGEGFDRMAGQGLGTASTILIPRVSSSADPAQAPTAAPRLKGKRLGWLPVSAALLVSLLLVTGIIVAVAASSDPSGESQGPSPSVTAAEQSGPVINGATYMPKGVTRDTDCSARAIGDIQAWLQSHPCRSLVRTRYETAVGKDSVAMLVADLTFPDSAAAGEFLAVAEKPGTGSITDPSTDGTPWPGDRRPIFDSAVYRTKQNNVQVRIVQAVWLGKTTSPEDPALLAAASQALSLPS
jgi:hypothetical protein